MRATASAAFSLLFAASLEAQTVVGRVIDQQTSEPVPGARVSVTQGESVRTAVTDGQGRFVLVRLPRGEVQVAASSLGYAQSSAAVDVGKQEQVFVELRLGVQAIPVEPLVVTGRRHNRVLRLAMYYDRFEWGKRSGQGRFVSRAQIDSVGLPDITDYIRRFGNVTVIGQGSFARIATRGVLCTPAQYLDGMRVDGEPLNNLVTPEVIEGVEIYRTAFEMPIEYTGRGDCGAVMVWTRDPRELGGMSREGMFAGAAVGAFIIGALLGVF